MQISSEQEETHHFNLATNYLMVLDKITPEVTEVNCLCSDVLVHRGYVKLNHCKVNALWCETDKAPPREMLIKEASPSAKRSYIGA